MLIGPLQLKIMNFIWKNGDSSVQQVCDALNASSIKKYAYSTILAAMRVLVKHRVLRQHTDSRAHIYEPLINESIYKQSVLVAIRDAYFNGSSQAMLDAIIG